MREKSEFSEAIRKIKEDIKLHGFSRNHLAETLGKHGHWVTVTDGDDEKVVERYFVSPEQIAEENKRREEYRRQMREAQ